LSPTPCSCARTVLAPAAPTSPPTRRVLASVPERGGEITRVAPEYGCGTTQERVLRGALCNAGRCKRDAGCRKGLGSVGAGVRSAPPKTRCRSALPSPPVHLCTIAANTTCVTTRTLPTCSFTLSSSAIATAEEERAFTRCPAIIASTGLRILVTTAHIAPSPLSVFERAWHSGNLASTRHHAHQWQVA